MGRSTRVPGAAGTQHRTTRHLRATASPFLPHLEPKSKLSSRPCPPPFQPAHTLDRRPRLILPQCCHRSPQRPPSPQDWDPSDQVGAQGAGRGLGHGCLQELDRSRPVTAATGGQAGVTGVGLQGIFLIPSMSSFRRFTRKDSPVLLPLCFDLCLLFQRHVPAKAVAPPYAGLGGGAPALCPPPPFLGQNGLDAYSVAAICARRRSVI